MIQHFFRMYREAYQGLPAAIWLLAGVMLINRSGAMVLPFMTLYLTESLHFGLQEAGYILSLYGMGALAGNYAGGWLINRIGYFHLQVGSLVLAALGLWGLAFLESFWALGLGVMGLSLVADAFRPANLVAITVCSPREVRARAFALNRLAINLGFSLGPVLGGLLASHNFKWLFWLDGATCLLAALFLYWFLPVSARKARPEAESPVLASRRGIGQDGVFWAFVLLLVIFATCFFQMFATLPLFLKSVYRFQEWEVGLVLALNGFLIVLLEMVLIYWVQRFPLLRVIAIGTALTGLGLLWLNLGQGYAYALGMVFFITIGEMITMPLMSTFAMNRAQAHNRGVYSGWFTMGYSLAHVIAPNIGMWLIEQASFSALWYTTAALCGLAALGFWILEKTQKDVYQSPEPAHVH